MLTLGALMSQCVAQIERTNVSEALLSVEWIVREVTGMSRAELLLARAKEIDPEKERQIRAMVDRRLNGEPVQYIVGNTDFMNLRVEVRRGVLIPRPETEELVLRCVSLIPEGERVRILDVGTGTGCIAAAIKKLRAAAEVWAIDINPVAVELARVNARSNDVQIRIEESDITDPRTLPDMTGQFDLIVFNPPYISYAERSGLQPEVRDFEPETALFADNDGLGVFVRSLPKIYELSTGGGAVLFEVHADRAARFAGTLEAAGFVDVAIERDLSGRERILVGRKPTSS